LSKEKPGVALITGVTGQDGSYLAELLIAKGYEVHGIKRRASSYNTGRVDHLYDHEGSHLNFSGERAGGGRDNSDSQLNLHYGDMTDAGSLHRIIHKLQPTEIYHLAAQSHVKVSFETPEYTANADGLGTLRLLECIRVLGLTEKTRIYNASTSEMFGLNENKSLNESSYFHPRSPYGVSKLFAHWMIVNYREAFGMFASNGILFNHESSRRGETFVTRKIVKRAVEITLGRADKLFLGNLDAVRDWGHARDYVEGMWKILNHTKADDFVLATGHAISVREFASKVFNRLNLPISWEGKGLDEIAIDEEGKIRIAVDSRHFRPSEVPYLRGDANKAKSELNWFPRFSVDDLIIEMIESEMKLQKSE
jgi:GDPmannose 4,6-dehydratase